MLPGGRFWLIAAVPFFVAQAGANAADPARSERELVRDAVQQLREQNAALQDAVRQRDAVIRELTEDLVIARTESELFRSTMAASEGQLFFRSDRAIYCVGKRGEG